MLPKSFLLGFASLSLSLSLELSIKQKRIYEYNNFKSDTKTITHGVLQGSIIGPLLFIIYINDFSRSSDLLFSIVFADDTAVFIEGTNFEYRIRKSQYVAKSEQINNK